MTILFLHGWHSVPGGVKPTYLKNHDYTVINPALDDDDFTAALATAQAEYDKHQPDVIVGSSRGGALAMNLDSQDTPLVLLCPAWKKYGSAKTVKADTMILHSRADEVIPFADSEELVRNSGLTDITLLETGSDHRLADPVSLALMLAACGMGEDEEVEEEDILNRNWSGLCYTAALRWVRVAADEGWTIVHGSVWSDQAGKRIEHAWCELESVVVDLALPIGSRIIERETYYRSAQPIVSKIYSSDDARFLAIKNRHNGPWDDAIT